MTKARRLALIWLMTMTATVLLGITDHLGHKYLLAPIGHPPHILFAAVIGGILFFLGALVRSYYILRE